MKKSSILFYIVIGILLILLLGTAMGWIAPIRIGANEVLIIIVLVVILAAKWLFHHYKNE